MEFTAEQDKIATHTALRLRSNVLPTLVWADTLGLDPQAVEGLPSPLSYGRLKYLLTQDQDL